MSRSAPALLCSASITPGQNTSIRPACLPVNRLAFCSYTATLRRFFPKTWKKSFQKVCASARSEVSSSHSLAKARARSRISLRLSIRKGSLSRSQRLRAFAQDVQVLRVGEDPVALLAGQFVDDLQVLQGLHGGADGRCTQRQLGGDLRHGQDDASGELVEHEADVAGTLAQACDAFAVARQQGEQVLRGVHGLLGGLGHAVEEETEPAFPVPMHAHGVEPVVVVGTAALEVQTQVQARLAQHALAAQDE